MVSHSDQTEFISGRHRICKFNGRSSMYDLICTYPCTEFVDAPSFALISRSFPHQVNLQHHAARIGLYFTFNMWSWLDVTFACSISVALFQFEICVCIDRGSPMEPETQLWLLALVWVSNIHAKVEVGCTSRVKFSMNVAKKFP